jgi:hypothetical protein
MGNTGTSAMNRLINFEDMQTATTKTDTLIISTLPAENQQCLITGTVSIDNEVKMLNKYITQDKNIRIILYGLNACDQAPNKKYEQLAGLGFYRIYIYGGGMFEWLLLQDIYGKELFPTTAKESDLLKYKGVQQFDVHMLCN